MSKYKDAELKFEKHVDECNQCKDYYPYPYEYCEIGSKLYSELVDEGQKDFDERVKGVSNESKRNK